jgi:hypothetical protein
MPILATGCEVRYNEVSGKVQLFWSWPIEFDSPTKPVNLYIVASLVFRIRAAAGDKWVPLCRCCSSTKRPWLLTES